MNTLASRLKSARAKAHLTQEELAELSGLKQSDISKMENGKILKSTGLVALARALQCDPDWLADGEGEMVNERTWPFALMTPEQIQNLSAANLRIVEKLAIELLNSQLQNSVAADTAKPKSSRAAVILEIEESGKSGKRHRHSKRAGPSARSG